MSFRVNPRAEVSGTFKVGELSATYTQLVAAFGVPSEGDGEKISSEWVFDGPGGTVTVYDWKTRPWPRTAPKRRMVWSVGARSADSVAAFASWVAGEIARATAKPAKVAKRPFFSEPTLEALQDRLAGQVQGLVDRLALLEQRIAAHPGGRDDRTFRREDLLRLQAEGQIHLERLRAAATGSEADLREVLALRDSPMAQLIVATL